ncbi:c-type cytochrome [Verrucomicrobiaceae bacterium 5K15]|uniref:C-type cytochrome n=1 Tax=Oceaniferula flava TaxID=2800421 RepID=A0AAE2SDB0_9BACT|nr:c-type cytochrome [Oceaniferula flavus]MBK1854882.1 c-type cytochrome [Oceaniferula flavus]MBM1136188.1 c-type cytochrome [Oceaniferula flavus]
MNSLTRQLNLGAALLLCVAPAVVAEPILPGLVSSKLEPALKGRVLIEELNCAACHQSDGSFAKDSKTAPRLADIGSRVNPAYIEKFITDPHGTKPGTTMPDLLSHMDAKEKKETAKAITHYLLSLKKNTFEPEAPDSVAANQGNQLFHTRGCVACHSPRDAAGKELMPGKSVPLGALDQKYSADSLIAFLKNPQHSRPSGRMPDLELPAEEVRSIANYLLQDTKVPGNVNYKLFTGLVWEGLYSEQVKAKRAGQVSDFDLGHLGKLERRYAVEFETWIDVKEAGEYTFFLEANGATLRVEGVQVLLEQPSERRRPKNFNGSIKLQPGWRKLELTYFHAGYKPKFSFEMEGPGIKRGAIPSSMLSVSNKPIPKFTPLKVDAALAEKGREQFSMLGCASCHNDLDAKSKMAQSFADLNPSAGCLTEAHGKWAHYALNSEQRELIKQALPKVEKQELNDKEKIAKTLTTFNCIACHERDGVGDVATERNSLFTGSHPELGDQGRLPPALTSVGAKLTPDWLTEVMLKGNRQRFYMNTRMPQYGEKNVGHLVELFGKVDKLEEVKLPEIGDIRESKNAGYEMIGNKGFSCIACHDFNGHHAAGAGALDLVNLTDKIQKNWFHLFMQNPSRFHTTGIMPNFWPGGQSTRPDVLEGDREAQIEALWSYLSDGTRAKKPAGLMVQLDELRVFDKPEIARGRGTAGFRGIGVGYPGRLNLAFDSEEMALRLLWKNSFVTIKHGSFKAHGDHRIEFPPGVPFHRLKSMDDHWPYKGKKDYLFPHDIGYQFRGYRLDKQRRPTFRYSYGDIMIEDFFEEVLEGGVATKFKRTFTFDTPEAQEKFYFRAAGGKNISKISDHQYRVDKLTVKFDDDHKAIVRSGDNGELLIPVTLPKGRSTLTIEYQW